MKLWTAINLYEATGEGVTIQVMISYAKSAEDMKENFKKKVGEYFANGAEYVEGVSKNPVLEYVFSEKMIERVEKADGVMNVSLYGEFHANGS